MICFVCARRFPYVSQKRNGKIDMHAVLRREEHKPGEKMYLFGLPRAETERIFDLATYVQKYGSMGEGVSLDESHPEFDDWRVRVPFDDGDVNV